MLFQLFNAEIEDFKFVCCCLFLLFSNQFQCQLTQSDEECVLFVERIQ